MAHDWSIEVRDSGLVRVGQLAQHDLTAFVCVPRANNLGSWSVKLPDTVLDESGVRVAHALCAALRTQGAGIIVTGPQGVVLTGPMIFAAHEQSPDEPDGVWTIEGVSDTVELAQALAFPQPSNSNPATQTVANDVRTAVGETLLRDYVSVNIGPAASAARKITDLTLAANTGLGPTLTKSPRFQNLLELCQDIGTGASLLFDVVQVGAGRQFQVKAQQDVSASIRWDVENNQLARAKYGYAAPGVTRVFVAGQGEGTARTIVEVTTAASLTAEATWGRIEKFVDQRNTNVTAELTQAGLEVLAKEGQVITSLEVVPSSDMADGFMSTWHLGSFVTVVVGAQEIRAQVVEVPISITAAGVFVGAVVGDATGFDWESVLTAKQAKTESRVDALERSAERPAALYSQAQTDALLAAKATTADFPATAWDWWTPAWTVASGAAPSLGNGTFDARFKRYGKMVAFQFGFFPGTTTTFGGGAWRFSLPVNSVTGREVFNGVVLDAGLRWFTDITPSMNIGSVSTFGIWATGGTAEVNATVPMTWAAGDYLLVAGVYEGV